MTDTLQLEYDLYALPTAQHRAGLAGLLVVIETMRQRRIEDLPAVEGPAWGLVRLTLTERSLTTLFNDIYDATTEEVIARSVRRDRSGAPIPPLREVVETDVDPRTGKERRRTGYAYPQVIPKAPFLQALGMPPAWLKLWRDAVWQILRGVPLTRKPYEDRAAGGDVRDASRLWSELQREQQLAAKGRAYTTDVAGSLLLGAQAVNAEKVPFQGRPSETLLLHGWPAVMGLGEGWRLKTDGGSVTEEATGYVLSVPDVADVDAFVESFPGTIANLSEERSRYRPRFAVLALPEEGGLEYLHHLALLARARAGAGEVQHMIAGVEVYHVTKRGNSIVMLGTGHVPARPDLLGRYEVVRGRYRNFLFRGQLIRNLLVEQPWYAGFGRLFDTRDPEMFFADGFNSFRVDARRRFEAEAPANSGEV